MSQKGKNEKVIEVIGRYKDKKTGAMVTVYAQDFPEVKHICRLKGRSVHTGTVYCWPLPGVQDGFAVRAYVPPVF